MIRLSLFLVLISCWAGQETVAQVQPTLDLRKDIATFRTPADSIIHGTERLSTIIAGQFTTATVNINCPFHLDQKVLLDPLNFEHIRFNQETSFQSTRFAGRALFKGAVFRDLHWGKAVFDSAADFSYDTVEFTRDDVWSFAFQDSVLFNDSVSFRNAYFPNGLVLKKLSFRRLADFSGAQFDRDLAVFGPYQSTLNFSVIVVKRFANFDGQFKNLNLSRSVITHLSVFRVSADSCDFSNMGCEDIYFNYDTLNNANYSFSKYDQAFFKETIFKDGVSFQAMTIKHLINFQHVQFRHYLDLSFLFVNDSSRFDFNECVFPDLINFSHVSGEKEEIDLTKANFSDPAFYDSTGKRYFKKHQLFLFKSDVSKLRLDYLHFQLTFIDPATHKELQEDEEEAIYESLLNNFKQHGQMESCRLLDIEYQTFKWDHSWAWWLTWLPRAWWCFGYEKELIFLWVAFFVLVFTSINFFFVRYLQHQVYAVEGMPTLPSLHSMPMTGTFFFRRLWYSSVYTSNIFFRLSLKVEKLNYRNVGGTVYLLLMYVLGLVCLAYMANFVIQH